jgi:hypothetical protein
LQLNNGNGTSFRLRAFWISKPDRPLVTAGRFDGELLETGDNSSLDANHLSIE